MRLQRKYVTVISLYSLPGRQFQLQQILVHSEKKNEKDTRGYQICPDICRLHLGLFLWLSLSLVNLSYVFNFPLPQGCLYLKP